MIFSPFAAVDETVHLALTPDIQPDVYIYIRAGREKLPSSDVAAALCTFFPALEEQQAKIMAGGVSMTFPKLCSLFSNATIPVSSILSRLLVG